MKTLKKIELFSFNSKFSSIGKKESLILKFTDKKDCISFSEVSPLKGRSHENLEQAKQDLFVICKNLLSNQAHKFNLHPSIMFAMTSGLNQLNQDKKSIKFKKRDLLITKSTAPDLLGFSENIKVKIKGLSIAKAIELCKYLIKHGKKISVDCNGAFSLQDMLFFAQYFHVNEIQTIEEPLSIYSDLVKFSQQTDLAIALDESLYLHPIERLKTIKNLKLFVLKPTLIGGLSEIKALIQACDPIACTLSSSYESAIGISNIVYMANELNIDQPLGINTCRYCLSPILKENPFISSNTIDFNKLTINEDLLCPLILR